MKMVSTGKKWKKWWFYRTWSSESSSRNSGGQRSGLVERPWPSLTKVGPNLVKVSLNSTARDLLFCTSWPCNWSIQSFNPNEPSPIRIWRVLRSTWSWFTTTGIRISNLKLSMFIQGKVEEQFQNFGEFNKLGKTHLEGTRSVI